MADENITDGSPGHTNKKTQQMVEDCGIVAHWLIMAQPNTKTGFRAVARVAKNFATHVSTISRVLKWAQQNFSQFWKLTASPR
jgi:hypothetical protein